MTAPSTTARPAPRRRPRARLRAVPDMGPVAPEKTVAAPAVPDPGPVAPEKTVAAPAVPDRGPVAPGKTVAAPAVPDPEAVAAPPEVTRSTAPLTVTISVDGGAPEARDRLLSALRDLVATAGREAVDVARREAGVVHVDPEPRAVFRDGRLLGLSRIEYDLLLFLARHPRQVFSRGQLLAEVWGHVHTGARTVDVHVSRLRQKLGGPELIATVYGVGYRLADAAPVRVVPPRAGGVSWTA